MAVPVQVRPGARKKASRKTGFFCYRFMQYFVYILFSEKLNKFYVGTTTSVEERLVKHNEGFYENAFTKNGVPWIVYLSIECDNSELAYKLEKFIKKMKSSASGLKSCGQQWPCRFKSARVTKN